MSCRWSAQSAAHVDALYAALKSIRSKVKQRVQPRLTALVLNADANFGLPFVSAKLIPERSGETAYGRYINVPRAASDGKNSAIPPESLWEGYYVGSGSEAYLMGGRSYMSRMLDLLRS